MDGKRKPSVLLDNVRTFVDSVTVRTRRWVAAPPSSAKERSRAVSRTFFLHYHAARIHPFTLRPRATLGLGLLSLSLFLILTATGILLMIYYTPSVERAYASINDIDAIVAGGKFVRTMHRWAAHGMVLAVVLHMARVFFTGSYSRQRTLNWMIGIMLLVLTLLLSFSGYLLPWDQLAFWAVTIGANIAGSFRELTNALGIPAFLDPGGFIKQLLLGGENVGQDALNRFYLMHVVALPLLTAVLIALHFWRIRKDGGLNRPPDLDSRLSGEGDPSGDPERPKSRAELSVLSWPAAFWAELSVVLLSLAGVMLASLLVDAPLREIADPSMPENPAKAPWYFLGVQELVSYSAFGGGIGIPLLLLLSLTAIPLLDREDTSTGIWFAGQAGIRTVWHSLFFSVIITAGVIITGATLGWFRDWFPGIPTLLNILVNQGSCVAVAYLWWCRRTLKRSGSTRLAAIAFFTCALVGVALFTSVGLWLRGADWKFMI